MFKLRFLVVTFLSSDMICSFALLVSVTDFVPVLYLL